MITAVFISSDGTRLAYEVDEGEGGIYVVDSALDAAPEEVDSLSADWRRLK
jgi:hypothetical protein